MQAALKLATTIQPGGRIDILDSQLPVGETVDVIVLLPPSSAVPRRSLADVLAASPGPGAFQTVEAVDTYIREERDSWER